MAERGSRKEGTKDRLSLARSRFAFKKMRLGGEQSPVKTQKLDKKIAGVFLAGLVLISIASLAGLASAADITKTHRNAHTLNNFYDYYAREQVSFDYERILYFEQYSLSGSKNSPIIKGEQGEVSQNLSVASNNGQYYIQYWQPIPQEYALGYIDFAHGYNVEKNAAGEIVTSGVRRICSSNIIMPGYSSRDSKWATVDPGTGKLATGTLGTIKFKNEFGAVEAHRVGGSCSFRGGTNKKSWGNFMDLIRGAYYLGEAYDVRQYIWSGFGSGGFSFGFSQPASRLYAPVTRLNAGVALFEFHFYPGGSLEELDDKYVYRHFTVYATDENRQQICIRYNRYGVCTKYQTTEKYGFVERSSGIKDTNAPSAPFTYDYEVDDAIASGRVMTAEQYQQILDNLESQVAIYKLVNNKYEKVAGSFSGFLRLDDNDNNGGHNPEGYTPMQSVDYVYLPANTTSYPRQLSSNNASYIVSPRYSDKGTWYQPCREKRAINPLDICRFEWVGGINGGQNNEEIALYFAFKASTEAMKASGQGSGPFTIAYHSTSHISGMSSKNFKIAYVVEDDLNSPELIALRSYIENIAKEYERANKIKIGEEGLIKDNLIEPERVLRMFDITRYGNYDPYTINGILKDQLGAEFQLKWYKKAGDQFILVDQNNPTEVITGDTIYYGWLSDPAENDPNNTCVSNNNESIELNKEEKK